MIRRLLQVSSISAVSPGHTPGTVDIALGHSELLPALAILPFGYPADKIGRGKKNRKPLRAIAHRERYGQPFE